MRGVLRQKLQLRLLIAGILFGFSFRNARGDLSNFVADRVVADFVRDQAPVAVDTAEFTAPVAVDTAPVDKLLSPPAT